MAARTELSGPACTGFEMEPNPKNAGQKSGYHRDSQKRSQSADRQQRLAPNDETKALD